MQDYYFSQIFLHQIKSFNYLKLLQIKVYQHCMKIRTLK